jgi:hypothetical protein
VTPEEAPDAEPGPTSEELVARLVTGPARPIRADLRALRARAVTKALLRSYEIPAPPEIHGELLGGRVIRAGDPIDVRLAKYLQHAVREEQWPAGTTFSEFVASLEDVVRSDRSGVYADRRSSGWVVTFVGRSDIWEGLDGGPYIVVLYDCAHERLVTAFQPTRGLRYVEDNARVTDGLWLTRMR